MKKNGFTLVEILAVIVILGIIVTLVATNVIGNMGRVKDSANEEQIAGLKDAAIMYATQKNLYLSSCLETNDTAIMNNCSKKEVLVSMLISEGYFSDKKNSCKAEGKMYIYRDKSDAYQAIPNPDDFPICVM